jgi:hypothetical protein
VYPIGRRERARGMQIRIKGKCKKAKWTEGREGRGWEGKNREEKGKAAGGVLQYG